MSCKILHHRISRYQTVRSQPVIIVFRVLVRLTPSTFLLEGNYCESSLGVAQIGFTEVSTYRFVAERNVVVENQSYNQCMLDCTGQFHD